jgi:acyl-CoA reductase-like NAD-dependent aldehyde dehydrogenase
MDAAQPQQNAGAPGAETPSAGGPPAEASDAPEVKNAGATPVAGAAPNPGGPPVRVTGAVSEPPPPTPISITAVSTVPSEAAITLPVPVAISTVAASPLPPLGSGPYRSQTGSPFPSMSPLDGSLLVHVEPTPLAQIPEIVARARSAQKAWGDLPVRDRIDAVAKLKKRLLARAREIAETVHKECGKPIEEAVLAEVIPNADLVDYWTLTIEELLDGVTVELDALAYPGKVGRIHKDPRGVLALITPWNYPVAIPLRTLVPALLAGNAVVFKPSEVSPRSGALIASLFKDILPDGVLELVQGGGDAAEAILDAGVDAVIFTGSVATGKRVAVACAERLIPCAMELGGKDAAIVLADCRLERTARGLVWGAFTNAGQNCASIERVYVERPIAEKLIARVVELTRELRPGIDTGVLTTQKQAAIVQRHVAEAVALGAEVLVGGAAPSLPATEAHPDQPGAAPLAPVPALAFPPTVIKITNEDCALMKEETFGPILPIVLVDSADEAIAKTNASRFGLTTSVWTKKIRKGRDIARKLKSGVVTINNHAFTGALPAAPWTGTGDSGYGITNSSHALAYLIRPRFVLEDTSRAKSEMWWYPYTPALRTIAFAMARLRGGSGLFGRIAAFFRLLITLPRRKSLK